MNEQIERTLAPLIGEPLSDMRRILGMQIFEFGVQRPAKNHKGEDITLADQSFHVSCYWRIDGPEGVIVSFEDFGPDRTRRDEKAYPFYEMLGSNPPIVERIVADDVGVLRLSLSGGYSLTLLPQEDSRNEQWRFLPKDRERGHLVITQQGMEQ